MGNFKEIRTVLGKRNIDKNTVTLSHEHICCYSEYLNMMSLCYINKNDLICRAVEMLKNMKEKYNLGLFVDCTPVNIGRDIEILKKISEQSGVDIVCSTGFYYNYEPILDCMSAEKISDFIIEDLNNICAGVIKVAVEDEKISDFNAKLLKAVAIAQKRTGLPIILHSNANNRNAEKAINILFSENVSSNRIVVGHLSDTTDNEYIKNIAKSGCYVALDRLYADKNEKYIKLKIKQIMDLCDAGYESKILLSHDDAVFQGFDNNPQIKEPCWSYMFDYIIPNLDTNISEKIIEENPIKMLCGE